MFIFIHLYLNLLRCHCKLFPNYIISPTVQVYNIQNKCSFQFSFSKSLINLSYPVSSKKEEDSSVVQGMIFAHQWMLSKSMARLFPVRSLRQSSCILLSSSLYTKPVPGFSPSLTGDSSSPTAARSAWSSSVPASTSQSSQHLQTFLRRLPQVYKGRGAQ